MARVTNYLFGNTMPTQAPATALRINTALQGVPIPLALGGVNRLAGNIIDYNGFVAVPASSSSGGGGGKGGIGGSGAKGASGQYYYYANVVQALCEGPIRGLQNLWINGTLSGSIGPGFPALGGVLGEPDLVIDGRGATVTFEYFDGTYTQNGWGFTEPLGPARSLPYRGVAYIGWEQFALGESPSFPNVTIEVVSQNNGFLAGQPDGDPSAVISALLTNQYFGVGFPAPCLAALTNYQSYALATGFAESPILAASFLNDLLTATNSAAAWQDGFLNVVPYGDQTVTVGEIETAVETYAVPDSPTAPGVVNGENFTLVFPKVKVTFAGTFAADGGVTYGSGIPLTRVTSLAQSGLPGSGSPNVGQYYVNAGVYYFNAFDVGSEIIITYTYAAQASYVPQTQTLYDFTIDDCVQNQSTIGSGISDPSSPFVAITKPRDRMLTSVKLEYLDRNNQYNPVDIEVKDGAAIIAFGRERPSEIKQTHFFCLAGAAQTSAALQLNRAQIARTFQWTVGRHFAMILELMGIVTITDPGQGLNLQPVRITEIAENDDWSLTLTGEEFLGTATAPAYGTQPSQGTSPAYNAAPGGINAPLIFEPTDELGGGNYVWCAVSGQTPAAWGGANVWVATSPAGSYTKVGVVGPARMGVLSAALPAVSVNAAGQTIDQVDTLAVNLAASAGTLGNASVTDAVALADPCYVGTGGGTGEIICYADAVLTAANNYDLSYLVRGAFGTESAIAAWPSGTPFARLDDAIASFPFNANQIGQTLYIKFQSFNPYGGGTVSLADCEAYAYTIAGAALASPLPNVTDVYSNYEAGFQKIYWDEVSDFRNGIVYEIREGSNWASGLFLRTQAHPPFIAPGTGTYWIAARCQPAAGVLTYSETPVSIAITGNQLALAYSVSYDEQATGWTGIFDAGVAITGSDIQLSTTVTLPAGALTGAGGDTLYFPSEPALDIVGFIAQDATNPSAFAQTTVTAVTPAASDVDYGSVAASATATIDYGSVAASATATIDYGQILPAIVDYGAVTGSPSSTVDYGAVTGSPSSTVDYGGINDTDTFAVTIGATVPGGEVVAAGDEIEFTGLITDTPLHYEIPKTHWVISGYVANVAVNVNAAFAGVPLGSSFLSVVDVLDEPDFLGAGSTSYIDGWVEIATATTLTGGVPNWGAWQQFVPGVYPALAWKFRVALESSALAAVAVCDAFNFTVQFPLRTDHYLNQSVGTGGLTIAFTPDGSATAQAFNTGPTGTGSYPAVQVDWANTSGDTYTITNSAGVNGGVGPSLSGMTITFFNGGVAVARTGVTIVVAGA
jgi:hypothetical protein